MKQMPICNLYSGGIRKATLAPSRIVKFAEKYKNTKIREDKEFRDEVLLRLSSTCMCYRTNVVYILALIMAFHIIGQEHRASTLIHERRKYFDNDLRYGRLLEFMADVFRDKRTLNNALRVYSMTNVNDLCSVFRLRNRINLTKRECFEQSWTRLSLTELDALLHSDFDELLQTQKARSRHLVEPSD